MLMCPDTSIPVSSLRQFGTGVEVSWVQTVQGPKCLYTVHRPHWPHEKYMLATLMLATSLSSITLTTFNIHNSRRLNIMIVIGSDWRSEFDYQNTIGYSCIAVMCEYWNRKITMQDSLGSPESWTQRACWLVEPLLKGSLLWEIDR